MITAENARLIAEAQENKILESQLAALSVAIADYATNGWFNYESYEPLHHRTVEMLVQLGYRVEAIGGKGEGYSIYW